MNYVSLWASWIGKRDDINTHLEHWLCQWYFHSCFLLLTLLFFLASEHVVATGPNTFTISNHPNGTTTIHCGDIKKKTLKPVMTMTYVFPAQMVSVFIHCLNFHWLCVRAKTYEVNGVMEWTRLKYFSSTWTLRCKRQISQSWGSIIAYHSILWYAITYPCLCLAPKSSHINAIWVRSIISPRSIFAIMPGFDVSLYIF